MAWKSYNQRFLVRSDSFTEYSSLKPLSRNQVSEQGNLLKCIDNYGITGCGVFNPLLENLTTRIIIPLIHRYLFQRMIILKWTNPQWNILQNLEPQELLKVNQC